MDSLTDADKYLAETQERRQRAEAVVIALKTCVEEGDDLRLPDWLLNEARRCWEQIPM